VIELPDRSVQLLVDASNYAAVIVASPQWSSAIRVGADSDVARGLVRISNGAQNYQLQWLGWVPSIELAAWLAQVPQRVFGDPIRSATVSDVIEIIQNTANVARVRISNHVLMIDQAKKLQQGVDRILGSMQADGTLKLFNRAYRQARVNGESLPAYGSVIRQLRHVIELRLATDATEKTGVSEKMVDDFRIAFPWFRG
jgi:hypothetical protein